MTYDVLEIKRQYGLSDTEAIQYALDLCRENGGGTVYVPKGEYTVSSVRIYSDTTLEMHSEAVLMLDGNEEHYGKRRGKYDDEYTRDSAKLIGVPAEALGYIHALVLCNARRSTDCMLYADGAQNVTVKGGVLRAEVESFFDTAHRDASGRYGANVFRPQMIVAHGCRRLFLDGIRLESSPCFNIRILECENVICKGISIKADDKCINTDGINIAASKHVLVTDCDIDVGDDAIAVSNGEIVPFDTDCFDITVKNCRVKSDTNLLRVFNGLELDVAQMAGIECSRQIEIAKKHSVKGVYMSDCTMEGRGCAVQVNAAYGSVETVICENIRSKTVNGCPAIVILAIRDGSIKNVQVDDSVLSAGGFATVKGTTRESVSGIRICNTSFLSHPTAKLYGNGLPDLVTYYWIASKAPNNFYIRTASDIALESCTFSWEKADFSNAESVYSSISESDKLNWREDMDFSESFPALFAYDCKGLTLKNVTALAFGDAEDIELHSVFEYVNIQKENKA